jgi:hypothetical protein
VRAFDARPLVSISCNRWRAVAALDRAADCRPRAAAASGNSENKLFPAIGIALGLLASMDVIHADALTTYTAIGELALDGAIVPTAGVLPAAIGALARDRGIICPEACGGEAA